MKRCPECRRDYYDDSLLYCLDDGNALLEGPASADEPATAILPETAPPSEAATKAQIHKTEAEAEPQRKLGDTSERPSLSAHRAAKPLAIFGVVVVLLIGGFCAYLYFGSNTRQIESIAVMPFVNGSGNPDLEYLSDGMTETLISSLSQLPKVSVKARSSVFRYKGRETDPKTIGSELSVQAVLNGRVIQRGQELLLNVELIDARTENVLWSQIYNRKVADLVAVQSDLARDVSEKLLTKLSRTEQQQFAKEYTANTDAYNLYLRGSYHYNKRTLKDIERSIDYFQQAVRIDPNYAQAFAGLGDAYTALPGYSGKPAGETAASAREAALHALSLDDSLSEAHGSLAHIMNGYDYDFTGAGREYKRAIELNPKNAKALVNYGYMLIQLGKFDEGLNLIHRGLELEPLSLPFNRNYGQGLYYARRYKESEEHLRKTVDLDPAFVLVHFTLSTVYYIQGKHAEAAESYARGLDALGERETAESVRKSYKTNGWEGFERSRIERFTTAIRPRVLVAASYVALGERDRAFQEFERAIVNREGFVTLVKVDPLLDPLRDDPRFQQLVKKVGFPDSGTTP